MKTSYGKAAVRRALGWGLDALIDLLGVARCAACDSRLAARAVFCPPCGDAILAAERTDRWRTLYDGDGRLVPVAAFGAYGGPLADAIRRFKYGNRPDLARPLGELLRHVVREEALGPDLVVPVPLHPVRLARRGYNQAGLLATRVAREASAPLAARALRRLRHTEAQATLSAERRAANVTEAFAARRPEALCGRRILLVDDVVTTGSTVSACATALYRAGATSVAALALGIVSAADG